MKASQSSLCYLLCISGINQLNVYKLSQAIIGLAYANAKTDGVVPFETDPPRGNFTQLPNAYFTLPLYFQMKKNWIYNELIWQTFY